jgi:hypothetical protein
VHIVLRSLVVVAVAAVVVVAPDAVAGVFLNGVNIDGVTGQTFDNCSVTIDDKGNILITAKGYEVHGTPSAPTVPAPPVAPPPEPVSRRYFLVSEQSVLGMTQYDVDVYVNSQWVKRVASAEPQVVFEVTKFMRKGRNVVHFVAQKNTREPRRSTDPKHALRVHVGEGTIGDNNVTLDPSLVDYVRTAAETRNFEDEFVVTGR